MYEMGKYIQENLFGLFLYILLFLKVYPKNFSNKYEQIYFKILNNLLYKNLFIKIKN